MENLKQEAVAYINKDQAIRMWATSHGGIYVPQDERTPSNPYLKHVPDRDIVTPEGKELTLVNPAYLMRLIFQDYSDIYGVMGHLTSLKPLRPENEPDEWEAGVLRSFEKGVAEVSEIAEIKGEKHLRLMRPMISSKGCLKCHGHQGYRVGDIRGGLSVSVPFRPHLPLERESIRSHAYANFSVWIVGVLGIFFGARRLSEQVRIKDSAQEDIRKNEKLLLKMAENYPNSYVSVIEKDMTVGFTSGQEFKKQGLHSNDFIGLSIEEVFGEHAKYIKEQYMKAFLGEEVVFELLINNQYQIHRAMPLHEDGDEVSRIMAVVENITERKQAVMNLQKAKEEWERTFDSIEDPICILDTEHKIVRANRVMAEKLRVEPREAIGLTCYRAVHDKDQPIENCPHAALLRDGRPHMEEVYEERLGGYFLVSVFPLFDPDGKLTGSVHIARDISERKQTEECLKKSEGQLKEAQQLAHIGSWELDLKTSDLIWSDEIFRIFEINPEEFGASYEAFLDAIHPDDREMVDKAYTDSLKTKAPYDIVHRLLMPDGRVKHVREMCRTYYETDSTPIRSIGTVQDITEQKKAEAMIRENEERYRTLFDSDQVGVAIVDDEGNIGDVNNIFCKMLGYSREELVGIKFKAISHSDELQENIDLYRELIQGKRDSYSMEKKYIHKQGHTIWGSLSVFGIFDKDRKYKYGFATINDISKRKKYEEDLQKSLDEKSILLAEIHHRVKNNMQVISSLMSLQSAYIDDPVALQQFTETRSRIQAMALAHEMLYSSEDFSEIYVRGYVESLMKTTISLYASSKTVLKPIVDIPDIRLDPDTLIPCGLILNELLTNSIKHAFSDMTEGTIEISMDCTEDGVVSLRYRDNGKGLPEGYVLRESSGLGLRLVSILTDQLEGTVDTRNENGAVFLFTFPEHITFAGHRHNG